MKQEIEMERKFVGCLDTLYNIRAEFRDDSKNIIEGYHFRERWFKRREYRYFDCFEGDLEKGDISLSIRERENDFILTAKFPRYACVRDVYEYLFAKNDVNLNRFEPNQVSFWDPMNKIYSLLSSPLAEVVRLYVKTERYLYEKGDLGVEIALDEVSGTVAGGIEICFNEIEVESENQSTDEDIDRVTGYLLRKYPDGLKESNHPKWIKALKLARGEEL